jgi:hypothetical protein
VLLSGPDICGLITSGEVEKAFQIKSAATSVSFWQSVGLGPDSTLCSLPFQDEGDDSPYIVWTVTNESAEDWASGWEGFKVDNTEVGGLAASFVENPADPSVGVSLLVEVDSLPEPRTFRVTAAGGAVLTNRDGLKTVAELGIERLQKLSPQPIPALKATVSSPWDLSDAQVCALIRDEPVAMLLNEGSGPGSDVLLAQDESRSCSKGGNKIGIQISTQEPFQLDPTAVSTIEVNGQSVKLTKATYPDNPDGPVSSETRKYQPVVKITRSSQ